MRPMQLALNGRFYSQKTTGVQRMAREFVRALEGLLAAGELPDLSVRLLVPAGTDVDAERLREIKVEVVGGGQGHAWEQLILPRHVGDEMLLNLGNTAPVLNLLGRRPVAVVLHDLSFRVFPEAYRFRYRLAHHLLNAVLMRRADPLITVSGTERDTISRYYPQTAGRIVVAPNGGWHDDEKLAPLARVRGYGLYVGSLSRRKNVEGVVAAAIRLARNRGLPFTIVGGRSPILARIMLDLPADVRPLIRFRGQVEDVATLDQLYRGAAFLLFPSFYEASALPPLEAMARRCPVIASDIPSLVERCGDAALYCDAHDVDSIVRAADRILDEPELVADLVVRGLAQAASFTWRSQARIIVDALGTRNAERRLA